jgi:hypothetical protein
MHHDDPPATWLIVIILIVIGLTHTVFFEQLREYMIRNYERRKPSLIRTIGLGQARARYFSVITRLFGLTFLVAAILLSLVLLGIVEVQPGAK